MKMERKYVLRRRALYIVTGYVFIRMMDLIILMMAAICGGLN